MKVATNLKAGSANDVGMCDYDYKKAFEEGYNQSWAACGMAR
jgi:hypothetical protein